MTDTATTAPWTLTWRGIVFHEDQLAGRHLAVLAIITGRDDFTALEMSPANGHQRLMMMLATVVASTRVEEAGVEEEDALATIVAESINEVSTASVDEILGALSFDT